MAGLKFRIEADVQKVIELRTEIKKLETALRYMQESTSSANFKNLVKELNSNREELVKVIESAKNAGTALNQNLGTGTTGAVQGMDKLSEAIRVYNIEEKKLGQNVRDLKMDQRGTDKQSEEYKKMAATIVELQKEQNRYKDLLFQLREEKKRVNIENKNAIVSEKELDSIIKNGAKSIAEANEQNRRLRQTVKQIKDGDVEATAQRHKYNEVINRNTEYVRRNSDAMARQKMDVGGYKQAINDAWVSIKNGTNSMQNMGVVAKSVGGMLKGSMSNGLRSVQMSVSSMMSGFIGAQAIISAFQKAIGFIKSGITSVVDFEQINSNLQAILRTSKDGIKDLEFDAKRLGAITRYTASEVTSLQLELAKAGFRQSDILNSTESILKFAQATGATLSDAASLAGSSLMAFGDSTQETGRYVSAMAVATTKSALNFNYLNNAMSTVAPVAKAFNFSIEDTLALLGNLADAGFDASSAATATRNILLNLADSNGKLAKALGGSVGSLPELVEGLKKLNDRGVDLATTLELTDKRSVAAFNTFLGGADKILALKDGIIDVKGELDTMASTMDDNVRGAIAGLSSAWEAFMLSFSKSTGPAKGVIEFITRGIRNITRQFNSNEDNQAIRNADAISAAQSLMDQHKIIDKSKEEVRKLYQENLKAGISADNAELKAKQDFLSKYHTQLMKENNVYANMLDKKNETIDKYGKANFFKQALWLDKTDDQYKKEIKGMEAGIADIAAERYKSATVIESINDLDLKTKEKPKPEKKIDKKEQKALDKSKEQAEAQATAQARAKEDLENKVAQAAIDAKKAGSDKIIAQMNFDHQKEIQALERNKQDYLKKKQEVEKSFFESDVKNKDKKFDTSSVALNVGENKMFDDLAVSINNKYAAKETAIYTDLLTKYQGYTEKRLEVQKKFQADRDNLVNAGASKESLNENAYQEEKTLKAIDSEFAMREESFEVWINGITNLGLEELRKQLVDAEKELERMEFLTPNSPELATQRAKVDTLKNATNKPEIQASPSKRSIKEWGDLYTVLGKVDKQFDEIGNSVGGTAGKILKSAGGITTATLQMVDSIIMTGKGSADAMVGASTAAATAIKTVEKASVILAIIGAALQIATKISDMFGADYSKYEKAKENYENYVEVLDQVIDKQKELIETMTGDAAVNASEKAIELIEKQTEAAKVLGKERLGAGASMGSHSIGRRQWKRIGGDLRETAKEIIGYDFFGGKGMYGLFDLSVEQMEKLKSDAPAFWGKLDGDVRDYLDQIIEGNTRIEEMKELLNENLTQVSFDSLQSDYLDMLMNLDSSNLDLAENFQEYLQKSILNSMLVSKYQGRLRGWYDEFARANEDKEGITRWEYDKLQDQWNKIATDALKERDSLKDIFNWSGKGTDINTTKGAFQAISQETGGKLEGRFTALVELLKLFRDDYNRSGSVSYQTSFDAINQAQSKSFGVIDEIRTIQVNSYLEIQGIRENTGDTVKELRGMGETLERIDRNIKNLAE